LLLQGIQTIHRTSEQHAQKTTQTQYRNNIHDNLLTDMLLTALQEMQHNSNITTVVHTATTQNVQSLAESTFIRKNKKNTPFHSGVQMHIPAMRSPFADFC